MAGAPKQEVEFGSVMDDADKPVISRVRLLETLWISLAYFSTSWTGLSLAIPPTNVSPIWPASGLGAALVMLMGYRVLPGIWLGGASSIMLSSILSPDHHSIYISIVAASCLGVVYVTQAALTVKLVYLATGSRFPFFKLSDVIAFVLWGAVFSAFVANVMGAGVLALFGLLSTQELMSAWTLWWSGTINGILVVTPLLVGWKLRKPKFFTNGRSVEFGLFFGLLSFYCYSAFMDGMLPRGFEYATPYLVVPFLIWGIVRWELFGAMTTIFVLTVSSVVGAAWLRGPFIGETLEETLVQIQIFTGMLTLGALAGVALYYGWRDAEVKLLMSRDELELKVLQRTEALSESEERYRNLVEYSPDGIIVLRDGRVSYANESFVRLIGAVDANALIESSVEGLVTNDEVGGRTFRAMNEMPRPGHCVYIPAGAIRRIDGSIVDVDMKTTYVRYQGASAALVTFRDISEIRRAERERVRLSEQIDFERNRLLRVLEQMPIGVVITEVPSGQVIDVNEAFLSIVGVNPERLRSLIDFAVLGLYRPDGHRCEQEEMPLYRAAVLGEDVPLEELIYESPGGVRKVVEIEARPVRNRAGQIAAAVLTAYDVTEQKRVQDTLKESEERFRILADSIPQITWSNTRFGEVTYLSSRWYEYTGMSWEESKGMGWVRALHPDDAGGPLQRWLQSLQSDREYETEYRLRSKEGRYRWFLARNKPFYGPDGKVRRWFGTSTDIDDRKRYDDERNRLLNVEREARNEAERVNRAKDVFLATLSHELKTPLSSILAWSQLLRVHSLSDEKRSIGLEIIEKSARAQSVLIEDMLDMSRIIMGKLKLEPERINPASVVDDAIRMIRAQIEAKALRLFTEIDDQAGEVICDRSRLVQILLNLMTNAIKFTPEGGALTVRILRSNEWLRIQISDTGRGIDPEFLPHIFDRFTQAENAKGRGHGGLGLGLAIVHQLVEMHGGSVQVESAGLGRGATFSVDLPLASSESARRFEFGERSA